MAKNQILEELKLGNRVPVRHKSGDITKRPAVVIGTELRDMNENNLQRTDIRNASLSLFRERRRQLSTLPKNRDETHTSITKIDTMTSKQENFVIVNDQDSGIVIFSTASNIACLCNDVEDLLIDGTFKCCPRYFYHGNYVLLVWRKIQSLGLSALYKNNLQMWENGYPNSSGFHSKILLPPPRVEQGATGS